MTFPDLVKIEVDYRHSAHEVSDRRLVRLRHDAGQLLETFERLRQQRLPLEQFFDVFGSQMLKKLLPLCGHSDQHTSAISRRLSPSDQPGAGEPINQLNRAIVLEQHLIGEAPDHYRAIWVGLDHQQGLVLLRRDPSLAGRSVAKS